MNQPASITGNPQAARPQTTVTTDGPAPLPSVSRSDRVPVLVWVIAAIFVAVELAVSGRYGFQQDELYFIVAGHHLAFGYVDQPPLAPLLTRITGILGVSPTAIRIIPALAGGAIVIMAARLAALFGAGRFGRVLAALATACAPVVIGAVHVGNTTPLDLLAWAAVLLCVSTALLRSRPRWWLAAGAAAGVGLEADNLVALLLIGLAAGLLVSGHRPVLRTRWPWLGAGIAAIIWAPNIIWQATHGWPQLAMSAALHRENTSPGDYAGGVPAQFAYLGLLLAPLVIAGFVVLWRTRELRFIAVAATLILIYVLAWVPGKVYYADGTAPAVLAAGAVGAERWIARARAPRMAALAGGRRDARGHGSRPAGPAADPAGQCRAHLAGFFSAQLGRRLHRLATAHPRGRGAGRDPGAGRSAAHLDLHRLLPGSRHAHRPWRRLPPAAGALRPQRLLDVGTRTGLRPDGTRGRRAQPTTALLR